MTDGWQPAPAYPEPREPTAGRGAGKWGYREILALAAVTVMGQFLAAVIVSAIAGGAGAEEAAEALWAEPSIAVAMQVLAWLPGLAYIGYIVASRCDHPLQQGLAWTSLEGGARRYLRTGVLLAIGSLIASIALHDPDQTSPMHELFAKPGALWILGPFGVLFAPVVEELVFRGFVYGALDRMHGRWAALVLTTAVFAGLHGAQYAWQWHQLAVLLCVGAALGAVRMTSGSTKASALVHAAYNGFLLLVALPAYGGLG